MAVLNAGFFIGFIVTLFIGVIAIIAKPRQRDAQLWAILSLCVADWFLGRWVNLHSTSIAQAHFWVKISYLGAIPLNVVYYHFVIAFLNRETPKTFLRIGYFVAMTLVIMAFTGSLFIRSVEMQGPLHFCERIGPFYIFHFLIYLLYPGTGLVTLFREWQRAQRFRGIQIGYVLVGSIIGFACGLTTFLWLFDINLLTYVPPFISAYVIIIGYAIVKYRIMDINVVVKKTLVYSLVSTVLASVYAGVITLLARVMEQGTQSRSAFSSVVAASVITLLFNPLRNKFQRFIDQRFSRSKLVRDEKLMEFSSEAVQHDSVTKMVQSLRQILDDSLHPKAVALYLRTRDGKGYAQAVSSMESSFPDQMPAVNPWTTYFLKEGIPLLMDRNGFLASPTNPKVVDHDPVLSEMRSRSVAASIPLVSHGDLLGYLWLGEKRSEESYTHEDLLLLRVVANQAALAFERPKLVQEITGAFVHEIKMPLANISLPAELTFMDMADVKVGKKSFEELIPKIQSRMKYIMNQATLAGSRVEAVRQIAGIESGKHQPTNLIEVIQSSLRSLDELIQRSEVKVYLDLTSDMKSINGNPKQLEIVFVNLIKNAIEAMEEATERNLVITGQEEDNCFVVKVQDSGPGIPAADLDYLFRSHFTTKGSQGNGMGLYLSRQIIERHGGRLEALGTEGHGATFTVCLPLRPSSMIAEKEPVISL